MTETERLSKRLQLVNDALEFVRDCAQQDRKLSPDKHVSVTLHYCSHTATALAGCVQH